MYCLPSSSKRYAPSPRLKNSGAPPTPRKARTGELTPPGMWRWACRNKSCERVMEAPSKAFIGCGGRRGAARRKKKIGDFRRGALHVALAEHAVNHRQQIGAGLDQRCAVGRGAAADGGDRHTQLAAGARSCPAPPPRASPPCPLCPPAPLRAPRWAPWAFFTPAPPGARAQLG